MLQALIGPVTGLLDKFIPDAGEKQRLAHEIATMAEKQAHEIALAQVEVNKVEAAGGWFRGGWRPFVGWSCGLALFWHFLGQPVAIFILTMFSVAYAPLPTFDMDQLMTVLFGLLGMGAYRSFEKFKKVSS